MNSPLVLLTRRIPPAGLQILEAAGVRTAIVERDPDCVVDPAAILDAMATAAVLLSPLTERIDASVLAAGPALRGVANMAAGYNNIDVAAATAMGIPVSNTPGVLTDTTADLTWALLLGIARRIAEGDAYVRGGHYAAGFDMRVIAHSPGHAGTTPDGTTFADLDTLLRESDFVTIHAPLKDATRTLIGEREIALMKNTAYLINVARGELVDEAALVRALQSRSIAGAALDVFEREPAMAATNALAHLRGEHAPNVVNPEVYDTAAYRERVCQP